MYFNNSHFVGNNFEESGCILLAHLCADLLFALPSLYHGKKSERNIGNLNVFSWHLVSRVVVKEMKVLCGKEKLYCFCSFSFTMQEVYINAQVSLQTQSPEPFPFSFSIRDLPIHFQCLYFLLRLSYDAEILLDISGKVQDCGKYLKV